MIIYECVCVYCIVHVIVLNYVMLCVCAYCIDL